jgi:transposase
MHASQKRYPPELKERAVRMVAETIAEGQSFGVITRIARQLGVGAESLRTWVRQAEVVAGERAGTTTDDRERIRALERENAELRRANESLRTASIFFAGELDPRSRR